MEFFEAVANWADRATTVVVFERDEFDGWYARVQYRDTNGPYSAIVNRVERGKKERPDDYERRVEGLLVKSSIAAHKSRHPKPLRSSIAA